MLSIRRRTNRTVLCFPMWPFIIYILPEESFLLSIYFDQLFAERLAFMIVLVMAMVVLTKQEAMVLRFKNLLNISTSQQWHFPSVVIRKQPGIRVLYYQLVLLPSPAYFQNECPSHKNSMNEWSTYIQCRELFLSGFLNQSNQPGKKRTSEMRQKRSLATSAQ